MKKILFTIAIVFLYSCSTKQAVQKQPEPVVTESSESDIVMRGKSLYENNCTKCHKLYETRDFSLEEWKPILSRMQKKAQISDREREDIYFFISRSI